MKNILPCAILSFATLGASASGLVIGEYQLNDHPDGGETPPPYGLRLDGVLGAGIATLSMDFYDNTILTVHDNGGALSINIVGTLYGGLIDGAGGYISANTYEVDFTYTVGVNSVADGWDVNGFDVGNTGTLTNTDTNAVTTLYGMPNNPGLNFAFLADDHRLDTDANDWVGRGWLTDQADGSDPYAGFRDWLFVGTEIPAPSALAFLGLGGLVATRRRR